MFRKHINNSNSIYFVFTEKDRAHRVCNSLKVLEDLLNHPV